MYVEPAGFQRPKDEDVRRVTFTVRMFLDPNDPATLGSLVARAEVALMQMFPDLRPEIAHADDCRPDGYEPRKETDWPAIARQIGQTFIELGVVKPVVAQPMLFDDPPSLTDGA